MTDEQLVTTYWWCERCGARGECQMAKHAGVWEGFNTVIEAHDVAMPDCTGGLNAIRVSMEPPRPWQPPADDAALPPIAEWPSDLEWAAYYETLSLMSKRELFEALKTEGRKRAYWENRCARAERG